MPSEPRISQAVTMTTIVLYLKGSVGNSASKLPPLSLPQRQSWDCTTQKWLFRTQNWGQKQGEKNFFCH
ncbi:hypothetical protein SKAU_G00339970 [Synaphobranchus kaupii]|uniref:Uncharacterized protein n=1 Tax=Synaphobranchus kaupii TaxID=118154 RepID=A0A9Q1EMX7_SYNKA|nr:hypothetical protein SKAU_G00339970 [Synaphobranchus kaupii]